MIQWNDYLYYDETSPTFLRWKIIRYAGNNYNIKKNELGEAVKAVRTKKKSLRLTWKSKKYYIHRVIWELLNSKIPENMFIDHIDGNPANNKISNLRLVSGAVNSRNQKKYSSNTSGNTGISYNTRAEGDYWKAMVITPEGRTKSKSFSVNKYGFEIAKQLAIAARKILIDELNKRGAGYTERHGT